MTDPPKDSASRGFEEHVQAAMERVAEAKTAEGMDVRDARPFLARPGVVASVVLVFVGVLAWNVAAWNTGPDPLSPPEKAMVDQVSVFAASRIIEAFREEEGRLPGSLAEVGLAGSALQYEAAGDEYRLWIDGARENTVYQSSQGDSILWARLESVVEGGGAL